MDLLKKFAFLVLIFAVLPHNITCTDNNDDDDMEDEMELHMQMEGAPVTLRLKKNDHVKNDVPVYTSERRNVQIWDTEKMPKFKVYVDVDNMASILVEDMVDDNTRTRNLNTRSYRGTFSMGGHEYVLRPTTRTTPRQRNPGQRRPGQGPSVQPAPGSRGNGPSRSGRGNGPPRRYRRSASDVNHPHHVPTFEEERTYIPEDVNVPINEPNEVYPTMPTVDLGDITEMSEEANTTMPGIMDDSMIRPEIRRMSQRQDDMWSFIAYNPQSAGYQTAFGVEMAIFVDYAMYKKFYDEAEGRTHRERQDNAVSNARFYFSHIANGVDLRYMTIDEPDFYIYVRLVALFIALTPEDSPFTENSPIKETSGGVGYTHAYKGLDAFELWISQNEETLPNFDQATLFSGNVLFGGLRNDGSRRVISGLADIKGVCGYLRASINADHGQYGSIQTAAHELGHNLGSWHDGNYDKAPDCTGRDQYVMASAPGVLTDENRENVFTFSHCSIRQFRQFLFYLKNEEKDKYCLGDGAQNLPEVGDALLRYPGQRFTADEQCQLMHGRDSYYCGGGTRDQEICRQMYCYIPGDGECSTTIEVRAADGTSCGNRKWCMRGRCEYNGDAPQTAESCIYGDYRGKFVYREDRTCSELIRDEPWLCYEETQGGLCCESCDAIKDNYNEECKYGDHRSWCATISPRDCYEERTASLCCQTCAGFSIPNQPETCKYGDHVSWCATMAKSGCYANNELCCKRCAELRENDNPECQWGDTASWCPGYVSQYPFNCYVSGTARQCCGSCMSRRTGPPGCEYGNKIGSCWNVNCNDPYYQEKCCQTCSSYRPPVTTTTTTTPRPTTTTTIRTTTTTSTTTTTRRPPTTTTPVSTGECLVDQADWCATMPLRDCYVSEQVCCNRCRRDRQNVPGCQYGDQVSWCMNYLQNQEHLCTQYDWVGEYCCATCAQLNGGRTTTTTTTTPAPVDGCMDNANWCTRSLLMNPGWCYDQDTSQETCCRTCRTLETGNPSCRYGDAYTWCSTMDRSNCASLQDECCESCKDYVP